MTFKMSSFILLPHVLLCVVLSPGNSLHAPVVLLNGGHPSLDLQSVPVLPIRIDHQLSPSLVRPGRLQSLRTHHS